MRQDYSSSHGISLPTDQFDCSRTLAHMVLYPHDDAMVKLVGEGQYVRWMDDQNMAVASKAEGLRVLKAVGESLGRLHLTPNSQKSKVLTLKQARRHYHLDLNEMLDKAEALAKKSDSSKSAMLQFQSKVKGIWRKAKLHDGDGEFGKILKRLYGLAGLARLDMFRNRSAADILADPSMVERVAGYYRRTGPIDEYLDFVKSLLDNPEQVYPDVNIALVESLLRIEAEKSNLVQLREFTKSLIRRSHDWPGRDNCAAVGALLVLRFGDTRLRRALTQIFADKKQDEPRQLVRASAIVYASASPTDYVEVRKVAGSILRNHLSTLVLLIEEIRKYKVVPDRYKNRLNPSYDRVARTDFVDMRVILIARLLLLSSKPAVRSWVSDWRNQMRKSSISEYDRRLLLRLVRL